MDYSNPLVSIIITCYNQDKYIAHAIESALNQTYRNIEIIVIDDGSTDNSKNIINYFKKKIQYFKLNNSGVAIARNFGFLQSNGNFINFLDGDDWLSTDKIEVQIKRFINNPQLDLVACGRYDFDESSNKVTRIILKWGPDALKHLLNNGCFTSNSALVRRYAFERVGGFYEGHVNDSWTEDTDLWIRLAATGSQFFVEQKPLCYWRHHKSFLRRSENLEASHIGMNKMVDRLQSLNLDNISFFQLDRLRALINISFCARFFKAMDYPNAKNIFNNLFINYNYLLVSPFGLVELYSRSRPNGHLISSIEFIDKFIYKMLLILSQDLSLKEKQKLLFNSWLGTSDLAYSSNNTYIRYKAIYNAILNINFSYLSMKNLPSLIRGFLGPDIIRILLLKLK